AGLGWVSGAATNTQITLDGTRTGFFFRTVPPDSSQSKSVSGFITGTLKLKRVYIIDDQEAYSTGLADEVQAQLKAKGVTVGRDGVSQQQSDFTAIINKIPRNTQLVYLPWQLPPKGQAFGQQMKTLGRAGTKLMGSDGPFSSFPSPSPRTATRASGRPRSPTLNMHSSPESHSPADLPETRAAHQPVSRPAFCLIFSHPRTGASSSAILSVNSRSGASTR